MNRVDPLILMALWLGSCAPTASTGPAPITAQSVRAHIEALPTHRAALGDDTDRAGLEHAERILFETLAGYGYEPHMHGVEFADGRGGSRTWHNIVADLPGTQQTHEVVVIGAHFDAVVGSPGADDNASGVAALLEIARTMRTSPARRTVRFILFNLEEVGMVGSGRYVRDALGGEDARERIVAMLSLEMLGYYSDEPGSQRSPIRAVPGVFEPPDTGEFIALVALAPARDQTTILADAMRRAEPGMPVLRADFFTAPFPDFLRSDHAPFVAAGVDAIMVTDTSNFRNPHYHTPNDTIQTLDLERLARVTRALAAGTRALADQPDAPAPGGQ